MPKSELLNQILTDYITSNAPPPEQAGVVNNFCDYADQWFAAAQPIGVGHVATNLSIRFSDGREFVLFDSGVPAVNGLPSVGITGNTGNSVRGAGTTVIDVSQAITGR